MPELHTAVSHLSRSRVRPPPCKRLGSWWEPCRLRTWSTERGRSSSGRAWSPEPVKKRWWCAEVGRGAIWAEGISNFSQPKQLLPPWSSSCIWHSWERIDYRGTWCSRRTPAPRRSPLPPGPPYTVNTWTPQGARNGRALPGTDPWNRNTPTQLKVATDKKAPTARTQPAADRRSTSCSCEPTLRIFSSGDFVLSFVGNKYLCCEQWPE